MGRKRFWTHLKALLWRNYLLKKKHQGQLYAEIFGAVWLALFLLLVKYVIMKHSKISAVQYPENNIYDEGFGEDPLKNKVFLVSPNEDKFENWIRDDIATRFEASYRMYTTPESAEYDFVVLTGSSPAQPQATYKPQDLIGINFDENGNDMSYSIRMAYNTLPKTDVKRFDIASLASGKGKDACGKKSNGMAKCPVNKYITSGFAQLQLAIDELLLEEKYSYSVSRRSVSVHLMDESEYYTDVKQEQLWFALNCIFAWTAICEYLAINIVSEKEKKYKEAMLMVGVNSSVLWLSWGLVYIALVTLMSAIITLILVAMSYFDQSNYFLLFLVHVLYGSSMTVLTFMLSSFFKTAQVAGPALSNSLGSIGIIYLFLVVGKIDFTLLDLPVWAKWPLCLLSPFAYLFAMEQAVLLDRKKTGFGFDGSLTNEDFPMFASILMIFVDTLLYSLLAVYLDNVLPGQYGTRYPPYYFLMPSYWRHRKPNGDEMFKEIQNFKAPTTTEDVEPVSKELEGSMAIRIASLTKAFKVNEKLQNAVDDFSMDIYTNHITCLLGHNGAGKTTLINMLTGVTPPTSGSARIFGMDITKKQDMEDIRRMCGICTQENILYDELTCEEHLVLFSRLKCVPKDQVAYTVKAALEEIDLAKKTYWSAKNLSGGQKRKLSVAIALIGNPKLIFLDEPTAGMDPHSRHSLWSLLKKKKENRVILLTTHFMDEADILADRKVFIRKGKLRCCGSSLFLKSKFGVGYHLTMVVEPTSNTETIKDYLQNMIPSFEQERSHGNELSFTLPLQEVSNFGLLFDDLHAKAKKLGIKSYGVSMTSLEEVFLKLEEGDSLDDNEDNQNAVNLNVDVRVDSNVLNDTVVSGTALTKQRLSCLFKIRFLLIRRNVMSLVVPVIMSLVNTILGMYTLRHEVPELDESPSSLLLQPSVYVSTPQKAEVENFLIFYSNSPGVNSMVTNFERAVSVDKYLTGNVKTSDVKPHSLGLQIKSQNAALEDFVALYNSSAVHSIPIILNMATQSLLDVNSLGSIFISSHPWPQMKSTVSSEGSFFSAMLIGFAITLVLPQFAYDVILEREVKIRGQLHISGINFGLYWGTIYLVDLLVYMIPVVSVIVSALALQANALSYPDAMGTMTILLITNIPGLLLFTFFCSLYYEKADIGTTSLHLIFNGTSVFPLFIYTFIVLLIPNTNVALTVVHCVLAIIFEIYCLIGGIYQMIVLFYKSPLFIGTDSITTALTFTDLMKWENNILFSIILPIIMTPVMYFYFRKLDAKKTGDRNAKIPPSNNEVPLNDDEDVKQERARVQAMSNREMKESIAYTCNLRKVYSGKDQLTKQETKKVAVRKLSIAVDEGEVLGLLGPNGAGKSSAISMIVAEIAPTCGQVFIDGKDIRSDQTSLHNSLGYCPQIDPLWAKLTLEEHIRYFAALKGVPPERIDAVIEYYISHLKLESHRKKKTKKLSGGTKRKLSYIMSILGSPHLVLMDEPSTGMDPISKRFLWDTITSTFRNTNKGAILTTHNMEEADAVCDRVGIMINGELRCLGSTQHLKNIYGRGYILEVKLGNHEKETVNTLMDELEKYLFSIFPGMGTVERFMERAQYSVPSEDVKSLGEVFMKLEHCKETHNLEEYSFSQSSLEQVFLYFAKQQLEEGYQPTMIPGEKNIPEQKYFDQPNIMLLEDRNNPDDEKKSGVSTPLQKSEVAVD